MSLCCSFSCISDDKTTQACPFSVIKGFTDFHFSLTRGNSFSRTNIACVGFYIVLSEKTLFQEKNVITDIYPWFCLTDNNPEIQPA